MAKDYRWDADWQARPFGATGGGRMPALALALACQPA